MKKFVFILIGLILVTTNCFGSWKITQNKKDALSGSSESYENVFVIENGDMLFFNSKLNQVRIYSGHSIFKHDNGDYFRALVGYYVGDELVEKEYVYFKVDGDGNNDYAMISSYKSAGIGEKIINHLKYKGNVQIRATTYSYPNYDITATYNPNLKWYK